MQCILLYYITDIKLYHLVLCYIFSYCIVLYYTILIDSIKLQHITMMACLIFYVILCDTWLYHVVSYHVIL